MPAKPLPAELLERVIADWRTGEYSQRELAKKHRISNGKVAQITKDVEHDCEQIVSAGIAYKTALAQHEPRIMSAIEEAVENKARLIGLLDTFHEKAVKKGTKLLDSVESALEFKAIAEGIDRISITAGINERHARPTQINNTTQTANFNGMTKDDLRHELKKTSERLSYA